MGLARGSCGRGQGAATRRCLVHRQGAATPPSPATPSCPKGYDTKGASAALALLDDEARHRRRRAALHLHPWCR